MFSIGLHSAFCISQAPDAGSSFSNDSLRCESTVLSLDVTENVVDVSQLANIYVPEAELTPTIEISINTESPKVSLVNV